MTRKQAVLAKLREASGGWVDGTVLATAEVGGSEGLKRLRELRAEGYYIEQRRHPNPAFSRWQYRLPDAKVLRPDAVGAPIVGLTFETVLSPGAVVAGIHFCSRCGGEMRETRASLLPGLLEGRCRKDGWVVIR